VKDKPGVFREPPVVAFDIFKGHERPGSHWRCPVLAEHKIVCDVHRGMEDVSLLVKERNDVSKFETSLNDEIVLFECLERNGAVQEAVIGL